MSSLKRPPIKNRFVDNPVPKEYIDTENVSKMFSLLVQGNFGAFRDFLSFVFSFIFDVTSDSELYALWWPKGTQKEVFEEPFRRDFEVSDESKNEAPV